MNVDKIKKLGQSQPSRELQKSLELSFEQWLDVELPKMIDEEIQKLQTTEGVDVALDTESLEETKKSIQDVIKGIFQ